MVDRSRTWGVRHYAALAVALAASAVVQVGCQQPAAPNIIVQNTNINTINVGQSGTDPAEGNKKPGSVLSELDHVTVNGFANGEKCPSGIQPANENRKIRLGCDLAVTVNPRRKDDSVIQDDKAPPVDFFILAAGPDIVSFTQSSTNSYNGDVHTKAVGKFSLLASVLGKSSGLQDFEVIK